MGELTVYQISVDLALLVALVSGIVYLTTHVKKLIEKTLDEKFKLIDKQIKDLDEKVDTLQMDVCKNFIIRFFADVENGEVIFDAEKQRFHEEWKYYTDRDGNSYLKEWHKKLKRKGYL